MWVEWASRVPNTRPHAHNSNALLLDYLLVLIIHKPKLYLKFNTMPIRGWGWVVSPGSRSSPLSYAHGIVREEMERGVNSKPTPGNHYTTGLWHKAKGAHKRGILGGSAKTQSHLPRRRVWHQGRRALRQGGQPQALWTMYMTQL